MSWTYQCKYVKCGKKSCSSCPHGPYWYRYEKRRGKSYCEYVGKTTPSVPHPKKESVPHPHDAIFDKGAPRLTVAWEIMGLPSASPKDAVKKRYRELCLERHPDRGGSHEEFCRLAAAYEYLRVLNGWR